MTDGIAIIGMACAFPKAPDLRTFWENIIGKVDAIGDPPAGWGADAVYEPDTTANDRVYCKRGGYLGELRFNPLDYGVMPRAVEGGEPEHFVALHVAHEALADAGYRHRAFPRERTEIILGRGTYVNRGVISVFQHAFVVDQTVEIVRAVHPEFPAEAAEALKRELKAQLPPFNPETAPGLAHSVMCGRIANRLDLMGAAYTVDAACASSLLAVEQGMTDLLSGKCDLVLAGGIQISTTFPITLMFCQLGALSRKGRIEPFHPEADGTLLGEGVGIVVLKRYSEAEQAGDRIYAVLKGVGIASDGRALGILAPRVEGEALAMRRAYERSGISPATIGLLEAHGTGTPVGDATEVEAIRRVFGLREGKLPSCALGSVKSMIGHAIPAAGVAGLIKATLALYHRVLPPTLHARHHPQLEPTPLYLNSEARPWVSAGPTPRRAAVNAFGFGGINAHAILEEHASQIAPVNLHRQRDSEVVLVAGESRQDLESRGAQLRRFLAGNPSVSLAEIAYAANCSFPVNAQRLAIIATSPAELDRKLAFALERLADPACHNIREVSGIFYADAPLYQAGRVAFLFPGEGAQYPGMLADLCLHFPEILAWFDLMDRAFRDHPRGFLPSQVVFPPPHPPGEPASAGPRRLWHMDSAIEAVFTANQALHALLTVLGIRPDAVVGHSTGEYSSLLVGGAVQLQSEAELIRYIRDGNRVTEYASEAGIVPAGHLLAVGPADLSLLQDIIRQADGAIHLAMDNCPHQVVLAGEPGAIDKLQADLRRRGTICQLLPFQRAYHTPLFSPVCARLQQYYAQGEFVPPAIPIYSCATAARLPDDPEKARQVAVEQWTVPVRFRETIEAMYADGFRIFIEAGPRGNLTAFVEDILRGRPHVAVPANVARRSGILQLHHLIGRLAAQGMPMTLEPLYANRGTARVDPDALWAGAALPAPVDRSMRLPMNLPMLRAAKRPKTPRSEAPRSEPALAAAVPPVTAAAGTAALAVRTPPPVPPRSSSSPPGARPVMTEYLHTMERFLETQEVVMARALRASGPPHPARSAPAVTPLPAVEPGIAAPRGALPFAGTVTRIVPHQEVVVRRTFDVERDAFLREHTLGPQISEADPTLSPLPVIPLALSLEMMAEAAALLQPGWQVIGVREVRTFRWIAVPNPQLTLEVRAWRKADAAAEIRAEIREVLEPAATGDGPVLVEATMCLAARRQPPEGASPLSVRIERPSTWRPEQLYEEGMWHGMFHGPMFQGVAAVTGVGAEGAEAVLRALPAESLVAAGVGDGLRLDPLLLDAAGQVVGFWTADWLPHGFVVFPVRCEAIHSYAPVLRPPAQATCRVRIRELTPVSVRADFEVCDSEGSLLLRALDWEVRRFSLPENYYNFRLQPKTAIASRPWPEALAACGSPAGLECCRLHVEASVLDADAGIWRETLAHLALSRSERETWRTLQGSEHRRTEWLLGRVAAKDAVRRWVMERHGVPLYPADIEISLGPYGQPRVTGAWIQPSWRPVTVSLAHAGGVTVALAGDEAAALGVGIDLEPVGRERPGFETVAFSPEEHTHLPVGDPAGRQEWLLRLWCAKEALAKALGRGLMGRPRDYVVDAVEGASGEVTLRLSGKVLAECPSREGLPLRVRTGRVDALVVAIVVPQEATSLSSGASHATQNPTR